MVQVARNDVSNPLKVANAKKNRGDGTNSNAALVMDNADDVTKMRSRLKTISAATYTDAVLDLMTKNDMLYALRVNSDAANVK